MCVVVRFSTASIVPDKHKMTYLFKLEKDTVTLSSLFGFFWAALLFPLVTSASRELLPLLPDVDPPSLSDIERFAPILIEFFLLDALYQGFAPPILVIDLFFVRRSSRSFKLSRCRLPRGCFNGPLFLLVFHCSLTSLFTLFESWIGSPGTV